MDIVRLYDPDRRPRNWTEIIQPGQFVVFAQHLESGASCDSDGVQPASASAATCAIFDALPAAAAFCRQRAELLPALRFDIFDAAGRTESPFLTVVHPSRAATMDGNPRAARRNTWAAVALIAAAPVLCYYDWVASDGLLILPTVLALNFLVIAARLLQLNGAHASAEKSRRERLAQYVDRGEL